MKIFKLVKVAACICIVLPVTSAIGQSSSNSKAGSVGPIQITKSDGVTHGRLSGADSMYVEHRVSFCLAGGGKSTSRSPTQGLRARFASKQLSAAAARGDKSVRGNLWVIQEPIDGVEERCSELVFLVHADAVSGFNVFDDSLSPQILIESSDGQHLYAMRKVLTK